MRISDWSSDVCSSDLQLGDIARASGDVDGAIQAYRDALELDNDFGVVHYELALLLASRSDASGAEAHLLAALDARSEARRVGKRVAVRLDLGGRRIYTKKKKQPTIT